MKFYLILGVAGVMFGWMVTKLGFILAVVALAFIFLTLAKMFVGSGTSDRAETEATLEFLNIKPGLLNDNHDE